MKTTLKIEGMMCEGCVKKVYDGLSGLDKVNKVDVNLKAGKAVVEHDGATDEEL
ncbi:MAG: heavy-metal-associated domain-containing protein, partial [Candidatus Methanomethylophilaceae archaeon]|nr:heavy-metal-associated domain-containing protein [Candidatus Methanomethylophilaceae archaeon]